MEQFDIGKIVLTLFRSGLSPEDMVSGGHVSMSVLDCTRLVRTLTDTREEAKAHLHEHALQLARVVTSDDDLAAKDALAALKGMGVISDKVELSGEVRMPIRIEHVYLSSTGGYLPLPGRE